MNPTTTATPDVAPEPDAGPATTRTEPDRNGDAAADLPEVVDDPGYVVLDGGPPVFLDDILSTMEDDRC
jgi:hypothetical protein